MKKYNKYLEKMLYIFEKLFLVGRGIEYHWLGSKYGGFFVNTEILDSNSVIYSFGIGKDISFDKCIIKVSGAKVYGFDPTPGSISWVKENKVDGFKFSEYGIGVKNGLHKMFLPKCLGHISGSVLRTDNVGQNFVLVELKTLKSIMSIHDHKKIDVLKLDIEGLEYDILRYIVDRNIKVSQIMVEFHDRFVKKGFKKRRECLSLLKQKGYVLFAISDSCQEFSFIKKELYNKLKIEKGR